MNPAQAQKALESFVEFLCQRQGAIIEEWASSVHRNGRLQTPERLTAEVLQEHLPALFDDLADSIRSPLSPGVRGRAGAAARTHGSTRFRQHYHLDELVREIAILRTTLVGHVIAFEEQTPEFTGMARRVALQRLHGFLDELVADAVDQFSQVQQGELRHDLVTARERMVDERGQRKGVQEDLESAQSESAELRRVDAARLSLLRTVAHELRNSLQCAQVTVHGLEGETNAAVRAELIAVLARTTGHMNALLEDLLDYTSLLDAPRSLRLEPVSLAELCEDMTVIYAPLAEAGGLRFEVEREPALSTIVSHRTKLVQIASNLLSNAIKYTAKGGVRLVLRGIDEKRWSLAVEDTGTGIASGELDQIFTEFHRVRKTAHIEGTGLGLAVVKRVTEILGGEVRVESEVGRGSRFEVILPRETHPRAVAP